MGQAVRTVLIHYHYSEKRNQSEHLQRPDFECSVKYIKLKFRSL